MSQRQLAQQSGVDHSTISRLIRGDRMPSLGTATKLARGLREIRDDADTAPPSAWCRRAAEPDRTRRVRAPRRRAADGAAGPPDHGVLPGRPGAPLRPPSPAGRADDGQRPNEPDGARRSGSPDAAPGRRRPPGPSAPAAAALRRPPAGLARRRPGAGPPLEHSPGHDPDRPPRPGLGDSERRSGGRRSRFPEGRRSGRPRQTDDRDDAGCGLEPVDRRGARRAAGVWSARAARLRRSAARRRRSRPRTAGSHTNTRVARPTVGSAHRSRAGRRRPARSSGKRSALADLKRGSQRIVDRRRWSRPSIRAAAWSASGQPPSGATAAAGEVARPRAPRRSAGHGEAARVGRVRRDVAPGRAGSRGRRDAEPDQDEHDRVQERVVVVVGQARDDHGEARWPRRRTPTARHAATQPAHGRALAHASRAAPRQRRRGRRATTRQRRRPRATVREQAGQRPGDDADEDHEAAGRRRPSPVSPPPPDVRRGAAHLREPARQLVGQERHEARAMSAMPASPPRSTVAALGAGPPAPGDGQRPRRRPAAADDTPRTWHCIVTSRPRRRAATSGPARRPAPGCRRRRAPRQRG